MRISDWSSDVCSSDLVGEAAEGDRPARLLHRCDAMLPLVPGFTSEVIDAARRERRTGPLELPVHTAAQPQAGRGTERDADDVLEHRAVLVPSSEEPTSELQSLMRISYAVFCLKKKHNT